MQSVNYHHLHYFWAVAHDGNLTRAAERLRVSQSAVSVQIQKLEAELGQALFERRGRQLELTEAGRIALDHADAIFAMGQQLVGTLRHGGHAPRVLRVGSVATLSRNFQLRFLSPLFARDDVEIVVRSGAFAELLRALEAHRIDVLLANTAPPRDAATPWLAHALAEQPVALVGTPRGSSHVPASARRMADKAAANPPAARGRGLKTAASTRALATLLSEERLIVPTVETGIRAGFDALVGRLGIRPHIVAEVDDMAMLRLLAREHVGLAVVPSIVVRDELESGDLMEIAQLPGLVETFYAITLTRRFPNPLLTDLLAMQSHGTE